MAHRRRSSTAERDLIEIWGFIANDDPAAADRQLDRLDRVCRILAENPSLGVTREDLAPGLRFFPVGNYLIFYTAEAGGIVVVRVLDGARDYAREFW
jgi:toxin ParE1/3/4